MKIHESHGVRTFRRDMRSIELALEIRDRVRAASEAYLSDVAAAIVTPNAYQAVERVLPFETGGMVYAVESDGPTRAWRKTRRIVARPGRLEDCEPRRAPAPGGLAARVEARIAEAEKFTNVFALREEARRYMDGRLAAIEARLAELERSQK